MGWIVFCIIAYLLALIIVPIKQLKRLWPAGIIALVVIYGIDSTLIGLGAFSYSFASSLLSGLPILYWISAFPGGILLAYLYPSKKPWRLLYILLAAAVYLGMELVMYLLGYFQYGLWNPVMSYFLNVGGFMAVLWLAHWLGAVSRKQL